MMHNGRIKTESHGQELLPKEGGYVMYPNHQGKYDTLGIMISRLSITDAILDFTSSAISDVFIPAYSS